MRIVWSDLSIERVAAIGQHIAMDNPEAARQWVEDIFDSVMRIEAFPESGRIVPEFKTAELREIFFRGYRIIYKIVEQQRIEILTVRHMRQLLSKEEISQ